jgi:branched-subunit amino acid transport protein
MGFIFLQEAMLVLVIVLFLFLFLSTDKKLARRIHLILPFIVYEDMSAIEVTQFLKEHPQFSYSGHKAVSINR